MNQPSVNVIKNNNKHEPFDAVKLHTSIYHAMLRLKNPDGSAHDTARHVVEMTIAWIDDKPEVTSKNLRTQAAKFLSKYNQEAAYLYKHHKHII